MRPLFFFLFLNQIAWATLPQVSSVSGAKDPYHHGVLYAQEVLRSIPSGSKITVKNAYGEILLELSGIHQGESLEEFKGGFFKTLYRQKGKLSDYSFAMLMGRRYDKYKKEQSTVARAESAAAKPHKPAPKEQPVHGGSKKKNKKKKKKKKKRSGGGQRAATTPQAEAAAATVTVEKPCVCPAKPTSPVQVPVKEYGAHLKAYILEKGNKASSEDVDYKLAVKLDELEQKLKERRKIRREPGPLEAEYLRKYGKPKQGESNLDYVWTQVQDFLNERSRLREERKSKKTLSH